MERCGANTNRTCGYLPARDLSTFVALGVRPCSQAVEIQVVLMGCYVLLEGVQIQHQGWGCELTQTAGMAYESGVGPGEAARFNY
jgi:hypothetical protein